MSMRRHEIDGKWYTVGEELSALPLDGSLVIYHGGGVAYRMRQVLCGKVLERWSCAGGKGWYISDTISSKIYAAVPVISPREHVALRQWLVETERVAVDPEGRLEPVKWNKEMVRFETKDCDTGEWKAYPPVLPYAPRVPADDEDW